MKDRTESRLAVSSEAAPLITRDLLLLMAAVFFYMAAQMLVTADIVGFSEKLGAAEALTGVIAGGMNIVALLSRPVSGRLAETRDKRILLLVGSGILVFADVGYALATSSVVVAVARAVSGIGFAFLSVGLATWAAELMPVGRVGAGMAVYGTVNAVAMAIGPSLGIAVADSLGDRPAFLIAAALSACAGGAVLLLRKGSGPRRASARSMSIAADGAVGNLAGKNGNRGLPLRELFSPAAVPAATVLLLFALPYCATQSYIVTFVARSGSGVLAGLFFPAYAVALLVMRVLLCNLFDRLSFEGFLTICSVSLVGFCLLMTFMQTNIGLVFAAVCMASAYGFMCSAAQATCVVVAGPGHAGRANATYYVGLDLGMTLGSVLGGVLLKAVGTRFFYPAFLLALPVAWGVWFLAGHSKTAR